MILVLSGLAALVGIFFVSNADASGTIKIKNMPDSNKNNEPSPYDSLFQDAATNNKIDWRMMKTISMVESLIGKERSVKSGINNPYDIPSSVSADGLSWGIMQMTVTTARDFDGLADPIRLNEPKYSIDLAARFIASLKRQFSSDRDIAMAYNQGAGNQRRFLELESQGKLQDHQYPQARDYWRKYQRDYKRLFL